MVSVKFPCPDEWAHIHAYTCSVIRLRRIFKGHELSKWIHWGAGELAEGWG